MTSSISRRRFVAALSTGCSLVPLGLSGHARAEQPGQALAGADDVSALPRTFPAQDPDLAREVVGKSHRDLEGVKRLVENRPALAKAAWDWGFGDWETALGAASHVGRPDIAEMLIAHGARPDIFTHAMLGNLEAVKQIIAATPGIQRAHGPHSITLMRHAEAGEERAKPVVEYLKSLGGADQAPKNLPLEATALAAMLGTYAYSFGGISSDPALTCAIIETRFGLAFQHGGSPRNLFHQGNGDFHPAGAPHVRITIQDGKLTISDGNINLSAIKTS